MKSLFILIMALLMVNQETTLFDFETVETSGKWFIVNDDVMGGISFSKLENNADGTVTFSGTLSSANNGGFASVRARVEDRFDNEYKGVVVRMKGDGNIYSIRFRTNVHFDGYAYQYKVKTTKDQWVEFKIPFSDFTPTFRGVSLSNKPELVSGKIAQVGLLIADYQFGQFTVDIDHISFYK